MSTLIQLVSGLTTAIFSMPFLAAMESAPVEKGAACSKEWIDLENRGHSSSIVKGAEGLIILTNGRTKNTEPKSLWIFREQGGKWIGEIFYTPSEPGAFCSSPVICTVPSSHPLSKDYLLFFRVGTHYDTTSMRSLLYRSTNGCATFTPEALPAGIIGPTKCKPLLVGRYLVFGSSLEKTGATKEEKSTATKIEVYDTVTGKWHPSPELNGDHAFGAIEPTFCTFVENGEMRVRMLCRNRSKGFALTAVFTLPPDPEEGFTWPAKLIDSTLPNCDSGLDVVDLSGKIIEGSVVPPGVVFAFGNFLGSRNSLELSVSTDGGGSWSVPYTMDDQSGEFPACIFDEETGLIHVSYSSKAPNQADNKDALSIRHGVVSFSNLYTP